MGVLSELIAAPKSKARLVAESDSPSRDWQGIVWKSLDQIKLSSLWSILEGEQIEVHSVVASSERMELAAGVSENGPWVFAIP
ncbi:MAG TPA: hypothetical protein VGY58_07075 [Gemmataceae bacterium]|jgi:hypothetical protein|nr:hypothetical protein [Gemmataceae bacterium]